MGTNLRRAIIVEDNAPMRELIQIVLSSLGQCEIVHAPNGAVAIDSIKANGADLVIMDWKMDVMDGFEATRLIRAGTDGINPQTPIILLTGNGGDATRAAAFAAGVDDFLEKPFSIKTLHCAIAAVLEKVAV